ncbi:MAG TPA: nucleotidyl transferase AbiEii/AbiGii toxin family protein [Candidatus Andersenbacteria bacterium]|nr:nucleotidyl transferase AbiEii/AbiGii toxin family protein [Candidatus Andersenbacteria bacterium]
MASIEDIACMKLSAITGRATNKDYIDLYFILELFPLQDLLGFAKEKYPELDRNILLKSLVYFEDVVQENILYKNNKEVPFEDVKKRLQVEVKKIVEV